jgi:hypothetical protein
LKKVLVSRGCWGDAKEALHVPCGVVEEVSGDTGEMAAG